MLSDEGGLLEVYLHPGEVYLARKPTVIRTILGSCVGVTFWSARFTAGALCHALLPKCPSKAEFGKGVPDGHRFVDFSIRDLARRFDRIGASRGEIEVKVFGGADVLPVSPRPARPTVGRQNCEVAIEVLQEEGFNVAASSVGGHYGRSIRFYTGTGEVRVRWLTRVIFEEGVDG